MRHIVWEYAGEVIIGATLGILLSIFAMQEQAKIPKQYHVEEPTRYICTIVEKEVPVEVPVIETVHDTVYIEWNGQSYLTDFTMDDIKLIAKVAHHEAGNQDTTGKRLVIDTILNRKRSKYFPDTVKEVIYQNENGVYQYAVAKGSTLDTGYYTEEEMQIVYEEILQRLDENVIYFQRDSFPAYGKALYKHGDHYFSGLKKGA